MNFLNDMQPAEDEPSRIGEPNSGGRF